MTAPPSGYSQEGVGFRALSNATGDAIPVYAYRNTTTDAYLLTGGDDAEKAFLDGAAAFDSLGVAFYGFANQANSDLVPVYRYLNVGTNSHFFTASFAERAFVDSTLADSFSFEGIKFWAYAADFIG